METSHGRNPSSDQTWIQGNGIHNVRQVVMLLIIMMSIIVVPISLFAVSLIVCLFSVKYLMEAIRTGNIYHRPGEVLYKYWRNIDICVHAAKLRCWEMYLSSKRSKASLSKASITRVLYTSIILILSENGQYLLVFLLLVKDLYWRLKSLVKITFKIKIYYCYYFIFILFI